MKKKIICFDMYVDDKNLYHKRNWVKDIKSKFQKN